MANEGRLLSDTKVLTGKVRFSYVNVFEPRAMEGSTDEKYSVCLIIPKSDVATINSIKKAMKTAAQNGKITKFNGNIPSDYHSIFRDGDVDRLDDEVFHDCYFINANCKTRPEVVDKYKKPITNPKDFYSGCYGHATAVFYPYNSNGNQGVACGLGNIMKTDEGEFLGGRVSAVSDFADIVVDDELGELA